MTYASMREAAHFYLSIGYTVAPSREADGHWIATNGTRWAVRLSYTAGRTVTILTYYNG
jgi:hypothetical protein